MVPYDELNSIEQFILDVQTAHPEIFLVLIFAIIFFAMFLIILDMKRKEEQAEIRERRARRRAWIKANGGL